jgi:hypothetical protein
MSAQVKSKLLLPYAVGQSLLIAVFFFVPTNGWLHVLWHAVVGSISVAFVVVGTRQHRPEVPVAWYLIALGLFFNCFGLAVETVLEEFFNITQSPTLADGFYVALYPCLIAALGIMVYRRSIDEDLEALMLRTAGCALLTMFLGIFAWEFIIWQNTDHRLSFARRVMVTAYPLADLVLIALILRLLFGGGMGRNAAFGLFVAAVVCFLSADIGWAIQLRQGTTPGPLGQHLLEMTSMAAYALVGASGLHPHMRDIAPPIEGARSRLGPLGWAALAICTLTAPTVVLVQALLDHFYLVTNL